MFIFSHLKDQDLNDRYDTDATNTVNHAANITLEHYTLCVFSQPAADQKAGICSFS